MFDIRKVFSLPAKFALCCFFLSCNTSAASVIVITDTASDFASGSLNNSTPISGVLFSFSGLPAPTSDGQLSVTLVGDLGDFGESLQIDADGGDDFNLFYDRNNAGEFVLVEDVVTIPLATLSNLTSDGTIDWTFTGTFFADTGPGSPNPSYPQEYVTLELQYETASAAVPEPSSLALLATGAFGFMGYGWRRKRKLAA